MCDLDMVVDGREMESAAAALRRVGWQPRQHIAGEVWEHALSGLLLDLQEPGTRLAREIFESAIRHPVYTDKAIVCMPPPRPSPRPPRDPLRGTRRGPRLARRL
jgi:hypothetical protein